MDEEIKIVITTVGGSSPVVQYSRQFRVISECGPDSTEVMPPNLYDVSRTVLFDYDNAGSLIDERFGSSNFQCPIQTHQLTGGNAYFSLDDDGEDGFDLNLRSGY